MPTPGPGLDHVSRRRNCRRGRCWDAVTSRSIWSNPTPGSVVTQSTKWTSLPRTWIGLLLDHDARAVLLPETVADTFDLPELFRLLERAVRGAILDDLLRDLVTDALELHQLLDVRGVDVDRRGVGRRGGRRAGMRRRRRESRARRQRSERNERSDDGAANTMHGDPPSVWVHGFLSSARERKPLNPPSAERVNAQSFGHARKIQISRSRMCAVARGTLATRAGPAPSCSRCTPCRTARRCRASSGRLGRAAPDDPS